MLQHQEALSSESSDADVVAKVMLVKEAIETVSSSTPEGDVLALLRSLQVSGPFSVEILRATLIGKAVNALMKRTQDNKVQAMARTLLVTWRDSVCPASSPSPDSPATPDKRSTTTPHNATPDAQHGSAELKRRRLQVEQTPRSVKARSLGKTFSSSSARTASTDGDAMSGHSPLPHVADSDCARAYVYSASDNGFVATSSLDQRDASHDIVLELDSGGSVLLQCDSEGGSLAFRNVCGEGAYDWVSDDQISETAVFWDELRAVASELRLRNEIH